jgi:phenylacetate-CoA ligase
VFLNRNGPHRPYWNPWLEKLDPADLQAIELENLGRLIRYAKEHSALFRERYRDIFPEDIRSLADVRQLPLIDKEDLRRAQEAREPFPYGDLLGVTLPEVTDFRQTSGTTGRPVYVPETYESWQWRVEVWCHILWMAGFRETDRVFLPFGYNVYVAFWEGHYAAQKVGCEVVPGGALDTAGRLNKIREVRATALLNTPTYGLHLGESAWQKGLDPRDLGIRRMLCAGEPLPPATRRRLESLWGAEVYDHIGGTEPCAWAAMCRERVGLHILEPFFLVEILDLETLSRPVEPGELGVAVVTPLGRRSFPLIRFNTKDVVRRAPGGCPCGRTSGRIEAVVGRADDLTKIRGVLFTPVTVEEVIRQDFPEVAEFEIWVTREGIMDEIALKVEFSETKGEGRFKKFCGPLQEKLKNKTNLRFRIEQAAPGSLPRYTLKAKRFKDLRKETTHD